MKSISMWNDKRGEGLMDLPINLLMMFICVTFLVALIPGLNSIIGSAQSVDSLNCHGYVDYDDSSQSANSARAEASEIGCLAIKLYIPYIVLGVLVAVVALIFYGRAGAGGSGAF